jgi:hypothetical protein
VTIHYTSDEARVVFAVVTSRAYPTRCAFALLEGKPIVQRSRGNEHKVAVWFCEVAVLLDGVSGGMSPYQTKPMQREGDGERLCTGQIGRRA